MVRKPTQTEHARAVMRELELSMTRGPWVGRLGLTLGAAYDLIAQRERAVCALRSIAAQGYEIPRVIATNALRALGEVEE
jgi:hypothetical protein